MRRALALAALLLLAGGALGGCSSLSTGLAMGGANGFAGPGAAAIDVRHKLPAGGCPDLASQGSMPATGLTLSCVYDPVTGKTTETASIAGLDPQTILLRGLEAQAQQTQAMAALLQAVLPALERLGATVAGGPLGGMAAGALLPDLPTLPGPAAQ